MDSGELRADVSMAHLVDLITGGIIIRIIDRRGLVDGDPTNFVHTVLGSNLVP